jgi:LuxR family transcriptional regulator, maltose regulon positive regulatory protein
MQARIELTRVHLALADIAGARTLMREVNQLLRRRPGLGTLVDQAKELRTELSKERGAGILGASTLTAAELRLLPLLSTHLSFREIAAEMSLSRNTVKSQAVSIYRKLGTSSRSQAVAQARELGLLEGLRPGLSPHQEDRVRLEPRGEVVGRRPAVVAGPDGEIPRRFCAGWR